MLSHAAKEAQEKIH
jgi:hypothetical protein